MLDPDLNYYEIIIPGTEDELMNIGQAIVEAEIQNCKIQQSFFIIDNQPGMGFEVTVYTDADSGYGILYNLGQRLDFIPYFIIDGEKWENRFATVLAD